MTKEFRLGPVEIEVLLDTLNGHGEYNNPEKEVVRLLLIYHFEKECYDD